jgi:hypothetical protein
MPPANRTSCIQVKELDDHEHQRGFPWTSFDFGEGPERPYKLKPLTPGFWGKNGHRTVVIGGKTWTISELSAAVTEKYRNHPLLKLLRDTREMFGGQEWEEVEGKEGRLMLD